MSSFLTKSLATGTLLVASLFATTTAHAVCSPHHTGGALEPDGVKSPTEACDDGNSINGDGCSDTCDIETGWECALPFNVDQFTPVNFGTGANRWKLDASGFAGTQFANTDQPSIMLFGADAKALGGTDEFILDIIPYSQTKIKTVFPAEPNIQGNDDDFIGLAFGFEAGDQGSTGNNAGSALAPNYFVFDWKDKYQSQSGVTVFSGMRLQWVTGVPDNTKSGEQHALWRGDIATVSTTLWSDLSTLTTNDESKGYDLDHRYRFFITYTDDQLTISYEIYNSPTATIPSQSRTQILSLSLADLQALGYDRDELPDGQLGFYTHSQPNAHFQFIGPQRSVCQADCGDSIVLDNPTDMNNHETCDLGNAPDWGTCNTTTCLEKVTVDSPQVPSADARARTLSGTSDPGSAIRITIIGPGGNPVVLAPGSNDIVSDATTGVWTWTTPSLPDNGNYTVNISAVDRKNGASSTSTTFALTDVITAVNDAVAVGSGASNTVNVLTNDTLDGAYTASAPTIKTNGTKGTATIAADGTLTYTANAGATGTDTVVYERCTTSPAIQCVTASVNVTIHAIPVLSTITTIAREGDPNAPVDPATGYSQADGAPIDPTKTSITATPTGGTATVDPITGVVTFTPTNPDVYGSYDVEVEVCAQTDPAVCTTQTLTFIWNDDPSLNGGTATVGAGTTNSYELGASPGDYGTLESITVSGTGCTIVAGKLQFTAPALIPVGGPVICMVIATETTPTANKAQSSSTWVFTVTDDFAPANDSFDTYQDTELEILLTDLTANDFQGDPATAAINGPPDTNGVITTAEGGTLTPNTAGDGYIYAPPAGFVGDDSFTYNVCSVRDNTACQDVTVTIAVNEPPAVDDETIWTTTGAPPTSIDLNDTYGGEFPLDPSTITEIVDPTTPGDYTVTIGDPLDPTNTTVVITPNDPNKPGIYEVELEFCDTNGRCETTTITLIVNDDPILEDDARTVKTGETITIPQGDLFTDDEQGEIKGGWDTSSILVAGDPAGPFGTSAQGGNNVTCAIVNGELQIIGGASTGTATCYVQICELNPGPAGTDTTDRACGVKTMEITVEEDDSTVTPPPTPNTGIQASGGRFFGGCAQSNSPSFAGVILALLALVAYRVRRRQAA